MMSRFGTKVRLASLLKRSYLTTPLDSRANSFSGSILPAKTASSRASISSLVRMFSMACPIRRICGLATAGLLHHEVGEVDLPHLAGGQDLVGGGQDFPSQLVLPLQVLDVVQGLGGQQHQDRVPQRRLATVQQPLGIGPFGLELHLDLQVADLLAVVDVDDER